jgi:hypothetical protein
MAKKRLSSLTKEARSQENEIRKLGERIMAAKKAKAKPKAKKAAKKKAPAKKR